MARLRAARDPPRRKRLPHQRIRRHRGVETSKLTLRARTDLNRVSLRQ